MRRLCERVDRRLLAAERALDHFDESDARVLVVRSARVIPVARNRRALRRKSLPTIAVAARASDRAVLADDHVAELARRSAFAAVNLSVEDDSRADAFSD